MHSAAGLGLQAGRGLAVWHRHLSDSERLTLALSLSLILHAFVMMLPGSAPRAAHVPGTLQVVLRPATSPPSSPLAGHSRPSSAVMLSLAGQPQIPSRKTVSEREASAPLMAAFSRTAPAEGSVATAEQPTVETPGVDGEGYFPASALDELAMPLQPVELALPEGAPAGARQLMIRVYINEEGRVDAVEAEQPDSSGVIEREARRVFSAIRFAPARRNGVAVKSYKRIEVNMQN